MNDGVRVSMAAAGVCTLLMSGGVVESAEHGGKEHGGQEHGGTATAPAAQAPATTAPEVASEPSVQAVPSAEHIRQRIESYVKQKSGTDGTFAIDDPETGATRHLQFVRVHQRIGKTGALYYSCTDMRDINTAELLDLDFDVMASGGNLEVVDARIHKVEGKARYTYDANNKQIPIPPSAR